MRSAVRNWRGGSREMTRVTSRSARPAALSSKIMPPRPRRVEARVADVPVLMCSDLSRNSGQLHRGDELLDPFVDAAIRVLTQHGALRLVVQLQVHPVDGEVSSPLLGTADEVAAQFCAGGLR